MSISLMCRAAYGGRMPAVLDENLQLKICRADMHGCLMKVTRALNSCLIGIQGNLLRDIDKKTAERQGFILLHPFFTYVLFSVIPFL